jgi:hypothetical protein
MPRREKAPATPSETASSSPPSMRGATSSSRTLEPNAAKTEASWQPVAAAPTTTTDEGRSFIFQTSLWVMACSAPGKSIRRAWPPAQTTNFSPETRVPSPSASV